MVFAGTNLARSGQKDVASPFLPDFQLFRHVEHPLASGLRL